MTLCPAGQQALAAGVGMATDTRINRIIGNYELIVKIAEGGMGAVYKGRNRTTGEIVAIKIVPADTARNPLLLKRFEQEFKAASLIDHPHVVKAIDYCGHGASPFLVMEFVDGRSLGARIEADGPIPEDEAIRIIGQVCEGLHRAHKQGLIHRDVKPDNILLTQENLAKLTDLGLVKDVEGEMNLTKTGRGLGTPHFMAPEQFRNAKNADVRCDVYSLGATLYTMVTGEIPFDKTSPLDCWLKKTKNDFDTPKARMPGLSERIDWAICRAMHHDAAKRPANCREFMEDVLGTGWRTMQQGSSGNVTVGAKSNGRAVPGLPMNTEPPISPTDDIWYMVYKDAEARTHTVKGSTRSIRKNLLTGALGNLASIIVSRTKTGQFQPLGTIPEFRDLALRAGLDAAPTAPKTPNKRSPAVFDTPAGGKTPTIPSGASQPAGPIAPPAADDALTEQYDIQPLLVKPKAGNAKVFPPQPVVPTRSRMTSPMESQRERIAWWPFAILGLVLLSLIVVVVVLLTK